MIGGGPTFPSHVARILTNPRQDTIVAQSARGPLPTPSTGKGEWGGYLTVRPVFPDRQLFAATGYTLDGPGNGSNLDATPRYVTFGRAGGVVPAAPDARRGPGTKPPKPPSPRKPLPPTPPEDGNPISDVNTLTVVSATVGQQIKTACGLGSAPTEAEAMAEIEVGAAPEQDKPGTERWPVKTGQDEDRAKVGKNVLLDSGQDLGMGIVEATLEELISLPRPSGLENDKQDPPQFQTVRDGQTEVTIWRIECKILAVKHEADGDYHLVLQGTSGQEMVGEIPTPTTVFVGDSPWLQSISDARQQIDDKVIQHISPQNFAINSGTFMPYGAMMNPAPSAVPGIQFTTPPPNSNIAQPLFQTAIQPTAVRLTGVGFFDRAHGQTGSAPNVIELHPVLKVEFL